MLKNADNVVRKAITLTVVIVVVIVVERVGGSPLDQFAFETTK